MPHPEHHIEWVGGLLTSSDGTSTRRIMWPRLSKGGGLPPGTAAGVAGS
jgi:hypothetical protein